jgi:hypothetical protein
VSCDGAAQPGDPSAAGLLAGMPGPGGVVEVADSGYLQYDAFLAVQVQLTGLTLPTPGG